MGLEIRGGQIVAASMLREGRECVSDGGFVIGKSSGGRACARVLLSCATDRPRRQRSLDRPAWMRRSDRVNLGRFERRMGIGATRSTPAVTTRARMSGGREPAINPPADHGREIQIGSGASTTSVSTWSVIDRAGMCPSCRCSDATSLSGLRKNAISPLSIDF